MPEDPLYLNHASYGPPPQAVADTVHTLLAEAMRGGPTTSADLHGEHARARAAIARLSGVPAERVALTTSTSQGLMQVAFGVRGEVLVSLDEFPANVYPWRRAESAGRLQVRGLPGSGVAGGGAGELLPVTPERIADALTPAIGVVAVSAVDFRTGYRTDLAGIRSVIGPDRLLVVDGIQGFGAIDTDWSPVDALVVGGQKWLRAGWGTGFMAFSEQGLARVEPTLGSWSGVEEQGDYDGTIHPLLSGAERHSVTNPSPFTSGALATALEGIEAAGLAATAAQIAHTAGRLADAIDTAGLTLLSPRSPAERAGIVVAGYPAGAAVEAHARLTAAGVTATLHGDSRIRFSPHTTTPAETVERVAELLRAD
ncbi:aminotransferase class V-fold PLP-dependent enzyme [Herbiconiux sp. CPCC 205763]|uniref:Aminotransferase class V-fold PLP-dependent enzyme n=1 Tax=Herbiconiux aconitum TaxID=2970913 RepID=A0ABT2GLB7_9MICO|nr:aminotransferase class V-fold PLP-dependent enzyme [Herbiconiux aconitum]MCS5717009.1 aminotransferase class V-fold PLP-dependent enzyme [Herbiconiux aconitum]